MILGGWETGSILTVQSGSPFTVLLPSPLTVMIWGRINTDAYSYPDKVNSPACKNPINPQNASAYVNLSCFTVPNPINTLGNAGRNSVIGPGLVRLGFLVVQEHPIREMLKAQFRAEFFNVLNHPNFQSPNDNRVILNRDGHYRSNAGAITLMNTTSRQIQFALKFTW